MISSSTAIRFNFKHVIALGTTIFLVTMFAVRLTSNSHEGKNDNPPAFHHEEVFEISHEDEVEERLPTLKENEKQVPVVIVDEHNEVIPYWYKAIDEGLMKPSGNTLVHIDGHSDMATPEDFSLLKKFKYKQNAHQDSYLPLMQANDVFITSAIMQGMVSHVVWVQPSWNDDSHYTLSHDAYIGLTKDVKTKDTVVCDCLKRVFKKSQRASPWECTRINRAASEIEDIEVEVAQKDCKKVKAFKYIVISENKFTKLVDLTKVKNLFVDIDEDFFGVQSGVQALLDTGVRPEILETIDQVFPTLFCPKSTTAEKKLNEEIKIFFKDVTAAKNTKVEDKIQDIVNTFLKIIETSQCESQQSNSIIKQFIKMVMSLNREESLGLSKANYCLFNSPRLRDHETRFALCHGTIYPDDDLNKIHVGDEKDIKTRVKQLKEMLSHIYKFTEPRLFTIARSLRDGYTPRSQQKFIEREVLTSLKDVITEQKKEMNVIYDKHLVFGKEGWLG